MIVVDELRRRPRSLIVGIAVAAALLIAAMPGNARADCVSSTPSELAVNADVALDNLGGAADIRELVARLDANCELTVRPVLLPLPLLTNQFLVVQFSFDPPPADPSEELVDREVLLVGTEAWLDDGTPLPTFEPSGFTVSLDELGITTSPMELGLAVASWYDPDPTVVGDEVDGDYHPELTDFMLRLPVSFTTPPPPTPPAAPPAPPTPPAPVIPVKQAGCVVPKLKGLTVKKAKSALKKAGCKYKIRGKGRVRTFSPKAGTTTDATINVKCKQKRKRKKRGR